MKRMQLSGVSVCLPVLASLCVSTGVAQGQTVARPLSEREKRRQEDRFRRELRSPFDKWVGQDAALIITDEERAAFRRLQNDEEREQFIEQFWLRRDPTPDTVENEFKEEHYRRIAYANEHFASGIPGWRSDRGRIYIVHGPPDERDEHPSGGSYQRPASEGGGGTSTYPFEQWRYRHLEGVGDDIVIEFVDPTGSGEYRMTLDPSEKDALLYVPGAGLTLMEQMGLSDKSARFSRGDGTHLGVAFGGQTEATNEFTRLSQYANVLKPPALKFRDMESLVTSAFRYSMLPIKAQVHLFPLTDASVLTYISLELENRDLEFQSRDGLQRATVNLLGQVSTLTRRRAATFEDTVTVDSPGEMLASTRQGKALYSKCLPLAPGVYRLNVIAKDVHSGNVGIFETAITVPGPNAAALEGSSIVLADRLEKVASRSAGTGLFVIGDYKVRPRVDGVFRRDEKIAVYWKIYNFASSGGNPAPAGEWSYEIVREGVSAQVQTGREDLARIPGALGNQVTIRQWLDVKDLAPGKYTLRLKVTDGRSGQTVTGNVPFSVT